MGTQLHESVADKPQQLTLQQKLHPGFKLCAASWCSRTADQNDLLLCRVCLVRLYDAAPQVVEALYDATTWVAKRDTYRLVSKALRGLQAGPPRALEEVELSQADALTRSQTAFSSFAELLATSEFDGMGYRPTLYVRQHPHLDAPDAETRHRNLCLANLYDRAQMQAGNYSRSVRS